MVGVENAENVERVLRDAKERYHLNPELVTCDFSPNEIGPVATVFGEEKVQIDGFHVMQELNRGIRADIRAYRDATFQSEIREFFLMRENIISLQEKYKETNTYSKTILRDTQIKEMHYPKSNICHQFTNCALELLPIQDPKSFNQALQDFFVKYSTSTEVVLQHAIEKLAQFLPKKAFTPGGMTRFKGLLLKQLKTVYVGFRKSLEAQSLDFFHQQWVLLFQPESLTQERSELLAEFLVKHPDLAEYREMTLQVGSIYRKPLEKITGAEIDSLEIKSAFSEKLQTAITTIKKFKESILRFVGVFKANPTLRKACRSNMEPFNRRFKAPFKQGLNCTKKTHLIGKLKLQLKCDICWLLDRQESA